MPPRKDARHLVASPETEPNFYQISARYPLENGSGVNTGSTPAQTARAPAPMVVSSSSSSSSLAPSPSTVPSNAFQSVAKQPSPASSVTSKSSNSLTPLLSQLFQATSGCPAPAKSSLSSLPATSADISTLWQLLQTSNASTAPMQASPTNVSSMLAQVLLAQKNASASVPSVQSPDVWQQLMLARLSQSAPVPPTQAPDNAAAALLLLRQLVSKP